MKQTIIAVKKHFNADYSGLCHGTLLTFCRVAIATLALSSVSTVLADDADRTAQLTQIFEYSGVGAHLNWVHATVLDESELARRSCTPAQNPPELQVTLSEALSEDALQQDFLAMLDERISQQELEQIIQWTESDAGKNIYQAELDSVNFNEAVLEDKLIAYRESGAHDEARVSRLKQMLADTGAVYFLSALNTELSSLVSMASVCSNKEDAIAAADQLIKEDRSAEAIYRSFMRQELVLPSGVVYQDITDADLDAISQFAKSEAGGAYYSALIKGVRSVLAGKVDVLRRSLVSMPSQSSD